MKLKGTSVLASMDNLRTLKLIHSSPLSLSLIPPTMKFLSWMQNKLGGKQDNRKPNTHATTTCKYF
ncbi:hypothetical protein CR513_51950, partial [Mucuna pruriens]